KLNRNPEVRRTVIGQVLSYAAYLRALTVAEFEAVVCRPYFDRLESGELRGRSFAAGVAFLRDRQRQEAGRDTTDSWTEEQFLEQFDYYKSAGRMRLLIAVV